MSLTVYPTNIKFNDNGEYKSVTAMTDLTAAESTVIISDTQPTANNNKLWVDTDAGSGNNYQVPTVAESLAMGVSGAKVGDLLRVNSVDGNGKPTSWKHVPLNEIKCNKNLLDNWYFVGGGSQLGDGVFPINQRGQNSYSNYGYCIDRWKITNGSVSIGQDGITLNGGASGSDFFQLLEFPLPISLINASMLISNLVGDVYFIVGQHESPWTKVIDFKVESAGLISSSATAIANCNRIGIYCSANSSVTIQTVKLELGSEQTLAHNEGTEENPVWVLNEIPNYNEELKKCQKYLLYNIGLRTSGYMDANEYATIGINLPITMAREPTVSILAYGNIVSNGTYKPAESVTLQGITNYQIVLSIKLRESIPNSKMHTCMNADCSFIISCEL